jgi:hypothetical protein
VVIAVGVQWRQCPCTANTATMGISTVRCDEACDETKSEGSKSEQLLVNVGHTSHGVVVTQSDTLLSLHYRVLVLPVLVLGTATERLLAGRALVVLPQFARLAVSQWKIATT